MEWIVELFSELLKWDFILETRRCYEMFGVQVARLHVKNQKLNWNQPFDLVLLSNVMHEYQTNTNLIVNIPNIIKYFITTSSIHIKYCTQEIKCKNIHIFNLEIRGFFAQAPLGQMQSINNSVCFAY